MKKIIEGKIYNTENAKIIFEFIRKYNDPISCMPGYSHSTWEDAKYLKTLKGTFLYYCEKRKDLEIITEDDIKKIIGRLNPDKYIELFGELEEG
ncbi:MAG: hypothetical protein BV456_03530 [Thermoplasmata archaeon M8B2D]|nr:MAG: hypothetical protein BV456_03530 [Thermoplasmata archaeon M8B2D]